MKPETWCLLLSLAKTLAMLGLGEAMTSAYTDSEEEGVFPFSLEVISGWEKKLLLPSSAFCLEVTLLLFAEDMFIQNK